MLFCDYALVSNDGKLSIIGEFDHLFSSLERPVLTSAFLVASLTVTPKSEFNFTLQLAESGGQNEVFSRPINVTSGEDGKLNLMLGFENLVFPKVGLYKAALLDEKKEIAATKLHIVEVQNPRPAQA